MTRFVDLAADKNASDFQNQLEERMTAKSLEALDARKQQVATEMFGEEVPVTQPTA